MTEEDDIFEFVPPRGSDIERRGLDMTGADARDLATECAAIIGHLEPRASQKALDRMDAKHKRLMRKLCARIGRECDNAIEQVGITAMCAFTLLLTANAQIDSVNMQVEAIDAVDDAEGEAE